ncbi:MAG TPA: glycosyltransferase [Candidatus Limnocylindria bacterium]|nr:glycosyltransferase [Candidatus Limnocylindria bacterium]
MRTETDRALLDAIADLAHADVIVGIPSFNNAKTIAHVVETARLGLRRGFPGLRGLVVNSDGGSADGTREIAVEQDMPELRVVSGRYTGPSGKGSALRAVFEAVARLGAHAACVVDSDLRSITPAWIERLLHPLLDGRAEYITPLYVRHKHDGTITNNVTYPVVRALYGKRVRQPIGGEFGFSAGLSRRWLAEDVWDTDVARFGIDVFMTTTALASGARVMQASLGAKLHDPKDPARHLAPMFTQVLTGLVDRVRAHRAFWSRVVGSEPVPVEGEAPALEPDDVHVDLAGLDAAFRLSTDTDRARWSDIVCASDLGPFIGAAESNAPAAWDVERAWARIVYDVIGASLSDAEATPQNVHALLPLYFARVAMHVRASTGIPSSDAEALVERQAEAFEAEKAHLTRR